MVFTVQNPDTAPAGQTRHHSLDSEYIKLDQALKLADIASTGGHAKFLIAEDVYKRQKVSPAGNMNPQ